MLSALWAATVVGLMLPHWPMITGCHVGAVCGAAARGGAQTDVACEAVDPSSYSGVWPVGCHCHQHSAEYPTESRAHS
eukprot:2227868-Pyramimonas_sp.AAC.1